MSESEKLAMLKVLTGETDEDILSAYLTIAGNKVCRKAYPFDWTVIEVPEEYGTIHVEVAAYLVNKRGAEGEISHSENGVSRTYENADVPASMLKGIVPYASVLVRSS